MSARGARAQVYGLQLTTIAKGAFLIRASIVFTPILSTIAGDVVPRGLWAGALLGFAGALRSLLRAPLAAGGAASGVLSAVSPALRVWRCREPAGAAMGSARAFLLSSVSRAHPRCCALRSCVRPCQARCSNMRRAVRRAATRARL